MMFGGYDLFTPAPEGIRAPEEDCGLYETRPVYGYDDCFPTVDPCVYPDEQWHVPDHGELCWLEWSVEERKSCVVFKVVSKALPVTFSRAMHFRKNTLTWRFKVENRGARALPFIHVMHPLMDPGLVRALHTPECDVMINEATNEPIMCKTIGEYLVQRPDGTAEMVLLRGIKEGKVCAVFSNGLKLTVLFPSDLFPTLGIWWNNGGYPRSEGARRREWAIEPIPGSCSSLACCWADGTCLSVRGGDTLVWDVVWEVERGG